MAKLLKTDVKPEGVNQEDLVAVLENIRDVVNELQSDHATYKTLVDELVTDHGTFRTVVNDAKALINAIRTHLTGDRLFSGNPDLAIDTNFDVQTQGAVVVSIDGVLADIAAATCDTGTTAVIAGSKWGVFLITAQAGGTLTATWETNSEAGYDDEASAIAALPAAPADEAPIGYVTVQAHANGFTAGTDALETGTGGDPSPDTNYYNLADPLSTILAAISTSPPAALSASSPAALSNSTPIKLTAG